MIFFLGSNDLWLTSAYSLKGFAISKSSLLFSEASLLTPHFFRDAGFHILITSYQLLVTDEKYFRRVKWQYMVLDEAQAIKSSTRFLLFPRVS